MSFSGLLNDTANFYERVLEEDSETNEQIATLKSVATNVRCALQHSGGRLDRDSRLIRGDNTDRLYLLPPNFDIKKTETVVEVRCNTYRVNEIIDMGGRRKYWRLDLEREALNE